MVGQFLPTIVNRKEENVAYAKMGSVKTNGISSDLSSPKVGRRAYWAGNGKQRSGTHSELATIGDWFEITDVLTIR